MYQSLIIVLAAVLASTPSFDQNRPRQSSIGFISPGVPSSNIQNNNTSYLAGLRNGLAKRGYTEGQNLVIEERYADGIADRLPPLISGLLAKKVDLLTTVGSQTAIIAQRLTSLVPIVFLSGDPIRAGLVPSLTHPGANLTGLSLISSEYSVKWPQLLKEVAPNVRRVALLWNPGNPVVADEVERIQQVAPKLGLEIVAFSVSPSNIGGSLDAISAAGVDGLIVTDDATFEPIAGRITAFAAERGLPAIWGLILAPELGALMSYHSNSFALGQRAAHYVDHIFKGASPSDLPIEQTTNFILRINLKVAKALGLTIPASLLAVADEVIE